MATPAIAALLAEVEATLGPALPPSLSPVSDGSDVFEAYIFSILLDAAEVEGANVSFENVDGSTPTVFTFRTSPGHIWSNAQQYTHAVLMLPDAPPLEAHLGVYVTGKSGLIHEADILVLLAEEAQACRDNQVPPRSKRAQIAAECKFYTGLLSLGLARGFVGLCSDLSARECFFVTNSSSDSVQKLLMHQRKKWQSLVVPSSNIAVERLRNSFQDVFKDFKAKYAV